MNTPSQAAETGTRHEELDERANDFLLKSLASAAAARVGAERRNAYSKLVKAARDPQAKKPGAGRRR